jgi:hypothetical protein
MLSTPAESPRPDTLAPTPLEERHPARRQEGVLYRGTTVRRHSNYASLGHQGMDFTSGLDAVHPRHIGVHEHDVRAHVLREMKGLKSIYGFPHVSQGRLCVQHGPQRLPHHRMVIHD